MLRIVLLQLGHEPTVGPYDGALCTDRCESLVRCHFGRGDKVCNHRCRTSADPHEAVHLFSCSQYQTQCRCVARGSTHQNAITRTLREGAADERRRCGEVGKDIPIGIVGHRDVQGAQWEGGREIWRILDERNDVGNCKVGQLGHVAGSRKTS
jgi:hypothetical protein